MKVTWLFILVFAGTVLRANAACSTCGASISLGANETGPFFSVSLGTTDFGQSAGELTFGGSSPGPELASPSSLLFSGADGPETIVNLTNVILCTTVTNFNLDLQLVTNVVFYTNVVGGTTEITSNAAYAINIVTNAAIQSTFVTNVTICQIMTAQAFVDVPPPTSLGYCINFYYPSQVAGTDANGLFLTNGTPPYTSWIITNTDSSSYNHLQVTEITPTDGILKQWNCSYSTSSETWTTTSLGDVQNNMNVTSVNGGIYQVTNTTQYVGGPIGQQTVTTYQIFAWGTAPIRVDVGTGSSMRTTTYSYCDPSEFNAGTMALKQTVVHPDGSQENYSGYDTNGNPTSVSSTFEDDPSGLTTTYDYTAATLSGSDDDGSLNPTAARQVVATGPEGEISRRYTVFPSVAERLDIQCTTAGAAWNAANNLVTTSHFYTSGPNLFALQSVLRPDGTMTFYDYQTNSLYHTNIIVTGQPDGTGSFIVDGISNQVVINQFGGMVFSIATDLKSGLVVAQDTYGNFDSFGRPQWIAHLDGTIETNVYACCGVNYSIDRNGINTVYLYDLDKRQYGSQKYFSATGNPVTYENTLDPVGRSVLASRIGTDSSLITQSQSSYDTAGRLVAQTNALGGSTTYVESADPTTGGLIRTVTNPDGGIRVESYYADGTLKSVTGTAVHPVRSEYGQESDANGNTCSYTKEIKLNNDGSDSSEWTKTYSDMAGWTTEVLYADGNYSQFLYNPQGQLWKQVDPDGVTTLYEYNGKGELAFTADAMAGAAATSPDFGGTDRITWTTNDVTIDHATVVIRSRMYAWTQNGVDSSALLSMSEASVDGRSSWQLKYGNTGTAITNQTTASYFGSYRTNVAVALDGSYTINLYSYGRLMSSARYDSMVSQIGGMTYAYDAHGRKYQVTDARNGTTTYNYNSADLVTSVTTPASAIGHSPETTTTLYDNMLRPYSIIQPDGTSVNTVYLLTGEMGMQYGSRTYPMGYGYDYAGRMATMTNWSNFSSLGGARVTKWNYDTQRGWLTSKLYDNGSGPAYTHTPAGRLATRSWVRGVTTTYVYDNAGTVTNILYSDNITPCVTNSYNRLGQLSSVVCNGMTDAMTYNLAGSLLTESFSGRPLDGLSVTNGYDKFLRRTNLTALGSTVLSRTSYGYDNSSRLLSVNDGNNNSATYSYLANSPLVGQITFKNGSTTRMTTTKSYDHLNRLTQISSLPSASGVPPVAFNYNYNTANQRTKDVLADGSYWIYAYDSLGQVVSGHKFFYDGTPVPGQQFDYTFDTIGNRTQTKAGGDATGGNQRIANYSANNLNQITSRDYPGTNDILGAALATNSVLVNSQTAFHKGEYFWGTAKTNNTTSPAWLGTIVTSGGLSTTGNVYIAQTPEHFSYDPDGNLTNDGRWAYIWDAENRLVQMTVNTNVGAQYQLSFAYDAKGRRIQKLVVTNGIPQYTNNFLYDGWNLIAILNPQSSILVSFIWGSDLSGTMQGAGGVGGLLEVSYNGSSTTNYFPAFDGNGNIAALVNAGNGTLSANYEYGPFGEVIRDTGPMAKANPIRFSTKYQDDESDLLYYGYRCYKPSTGTWPNRDPLGEPGFELVANRPQAKKEPVKVDAATVFLNLLGIKDRFSPTKTIPEVDQNTDSLYIFVGNDPIVTADVFGLFPNVCLQPLPISCTSSLCDSYGDEQYPGFGANLKCFCKCAGDSQWSKQVRGCLAGARAHGVGVTEAHAACYADATARYGAPPYSTLRQCFYQCGGTLPGKGPPPTDF